MPSIRKNFRDTKMIFFFEKLLGLLIISRITGLQICNTFDFIEDSQDFKDCLKQRFESHSTYTLIPPKENVTKYGCFPVYIFILTIE